MPDALVVHNATTRDATVAGRPLPEHLDAVLRQAGLTPTHSATTPALVLDARWATVTADALRTLIDAGGHAVLDDEVVASAHSSDPLTADGPAMLVEGVLLCDAWSACQADAAVRHELVTALVDSGVRVLLPHTLCLDASVRVQAGASLHPGVVLSGTTEVHAGAVIHAYAVLHDCIVGPGAVVKAHTVAEGAQIGPNAAVGPMAHLRQGSVLEADVKVGNFVETKKTTLRAGAKASHLSYLGDAEIGAGANIGAGTITCNYDGHGKHRTQIGPGAFIGSNTALVAPISIGRGAIVGAGSTLSRDVADDALAVERAEERQLAGYAPRLHERNRRNAAKRTP